MNWLAGRLAPLARREPDALLRAGMLTCLLIALIWLLVARLSAPAPSAATGLIGRPAPVFTLRAAQSGTMLPIATHVLATSGRPTLLLFFNTLCIHCLSEVGTARQAASGARGGPLSIVYVDTPGENAQITGAYMARLRLNPPVLLDSGGAVARRYAVGYGPTLILVDAQGIVRGVWVGETSAATLSAGIASGLSAGLAR